MGTRATCRFDILNWEQNPLAPAGGGVMVTRTTADHRFSGDIEGTAQAEFLMAHSSDSYAGIVGLFRFEGRIGERAGTCVIRTDSTFADGVVRGELAVVPGSATGALAGLTGEGSYVSEGTRVGSISLDHDFG